MPEVGVGGVGKAFRAQAGVQKGAGKALGSVIAEGDFRRAFDFQAKVSSASPHDPL